jgi:hypothetical protein
MILTHEQFVSLIKSKQGTRSLREYAKSLNVTVGYLSDVYLSRRDAGPTLAKQMGFSRERKISVRFVSIGLCAGKGKV